MPVGGYTADLAAAAARPPIIAGRLWLRRRPSSRLPPLADSRVAEEWPASGRRIGGGAWPALTLPSPPCSTLAKPRRRSLSTRPTAPADSARALPGARPAARPGAVASWEEGLGRSGCGARPRFSPYTSCRKSSAGRDARKLSAAWWWLEGGAGDGEGEGDWEGELGGVQGRRRRGGFGEGGARRGGRGCGGAWAAEIPRSSTSLASRRGGLARARGGKESRPRLSRQGVTGVLGPARRELGVLASRDE